MRFLDLLIIVALTCSLGNFGSLFLEKISFPLSLFSPSGTMIMWIWAYMLVFYKPFRVCSQFFIFFSFFSLGFTNSTYYMISFWSYMTYLISVSYLSNFCFSNFSIYQTVVLNSLSNKFNVYICSEIVLANFFFLDDNGFCFFLYVHQYV